MVLIVPGVRKELLPLWFAVIAVRHHKVPMNILQNYTLCSIEAILAFPDIFNYRCRGTGLFFYFPVSSLFSRFYRLTSTNTIEYKFNIAQNNHFTLLGGHESIVSKSEGFGASSTGQTDDRMTNVNQGIKFDKPSYSFSETAQNSFFVRLSYDYKDKYYLDATFRTDGSSLFGENNKYANFWSVGAMWNIKSENPVVPEEK